MSITMDNCREIFPRCPYAGRKMKTLAKGPVGERISSLARKVAFWLGLYILGMVVAFTLNPMFIDETENVTASVVVYNICEAGISAVAITMAMAHIGKFLLDSANRNQKVGPRISNAGMTSDMPQSTNAGTTAVVVVGTSSITTAC